MAIVVAFSACGSSETAQGSTDTKDTVEEKKHEFVQIKSSPDKYTVYIKDYVSRNCATIGYSSLGGDRIDRCGNVYLHIIFIDEEGNYIGIEDEDVKEYVVVSQSYEPNTEIKLTYQRDSEGEEYSSLVEWQNISEIVLKVRKIGSLSKVSDAGMTYIEPSPDKYTFYLKDYVGRNLSACGYISLGGDFRDRYGDGSIKLNLITEDGSYIDLKEEGITNNYVVTNQSVAPNSLIKYEFWTYSTGEESSLVDNQNLEEIDLYVAPISEQ